MARGSALLVAFGLIFAGQLYAGRELDVVDDRHVQWALVAAALALLLHLALTIDAAWLITGGLLASMFAGHWGELGIDWGVAPHRVLLGAGVLAVLLRAPPARDRPPLRFGAPHWALAAAVAYVVISAIFEGTLRDDASQVALLDTYGLVPFTLFVVAPVAFATERQRMILLGGLVAAGAYLSVTAVLEKLELYDLVVPAYIGDPGVGIHFDRARGPFTEAAANGVALYMCGVAAVIAVVLWRRPAPRLAAGCVAALVPVAVLLTLTRGAWLAAIAATFVALATTAGLRRHVPAVAAAGFVGVLIAFALIPGVADEARDRQQDKNPVYERQNTSAAGLRMVADRPLLGHGWWFDQNEMLPYYRLDPDIPLTGAHAGLHNIYLQYAVALGLAGIGIWALAVGMVFGRAIGWRGPPPIQPWQIGLKAVLAAWLVVGIFGPANYAFATAVVWTWAGVVWPLSRGAPEATGAAPGGDRAVTAASR